VKFIEECCSLEITALVREECTKKFKSELSWKNPISFSYEVKEMVHFWLKAQSKTFFSDEIKKLI